MRRASVSSPATLMNRSTEYRRSNRAEPCVALLISHREASSSTSAAMASPELSLLTA